LSFPIIQEFETLMQESIKVVINIHKCKFFTSLQAAANPRGARGPRACGLTTLARPVERGSYFNSYEDGFDDVQGYTSCALPV